MLTFVEHILLAIYVFVFCGYTEIMNVSISDDNAFDADCFRQRTLDLIEKDKRDRAVKVIIDEHL